MAESAAGKRVILAVGGAHTTAAWAKRLDADAVVHHMPNLEAAMAELRSTPAALILLDPSALGTSGYLAPGLAGDSLLEQIAQGTGLVDAQGAFVWANSRLLEFPEDVRKRVAELCVEAMGWAQQGRAPKKARQYTLPSDGSTFEVQITPVVRLGEEVTQVAAVVWDATRLRRFHEKLAAIERAADDLVSFDPKQLEQLDTQGRLDLLEQKVIRYTRELMHFDNFTVHLLDKKTNKLELVLSAGMPAQVQDIPLYAQPQGNGICGYVAYHGRGYISPDVTQDERYIQGVEQARSCLVVPLRFQGEVLGVFNVESKQVNAFTEDDRQFAEAFARHLARALHALNLLVAERRNTLTHVAKDVASELTGPLNDIVTEIGSLVEDYIGHDELRHRLNLISDNAVLMRDRLRALSARERGLIDRSRSSSAVRHDPVLQGRRILVVDDEEVIRDTVCDVLRGYGCQIEAAADGEPAIALIGKQDFDLVISDIKMPTRNGYEVFAAAKERNKDTPVILMTGFGYDPNHSIVRARREGLAAVLFKPFKIDQLLGEIRTAIRAVTKT